MSITAGRAAALNTVPTLLMSDQSSLLGPGQALVSFLWKVKAGNGDL